MPKKRRTVAKVVGIATALGVLGLGVSAHRLGTSTAGKFIRNAGKRR